MDNGRYVPAEERNQKLSELWTQQGSEALRSRGLFRVAMDASAPMLAFLQHLSRIEWPWSSTEIIPARENRVPASYSTHCGHALYTALYPHQVRIHHWKTEHIDAVKSAELQSRSLKSLGDRLKIDLCLLTSEGPNAIGALRGEALDPHQLCATYLDPANRNDALALTPWLLQAARCTIIVSTGLNPPYPDGEPSPLSAITEIETAQIWHHRPL